ncbi:Adaptive-response sensory-kinase SasA [Dyadobacter sp. CECT 9623]|uniref:histidine kinase n=1 Tax=Dyadobacter linearis TaxID=2823330 RepID=A0ABN7R6A0_9BACT|nr:HAMP domain-containing sensor histidine kinase [Dyadobacter sp. CECT 9623]CAG5068809.1 Adaptive-response sensory-kinase SasA [Dyadobacter sp. CECT 9623]
MLPQQYFYQVWARLSGDPSKFPLHARIFHSVCLISIFALSYNVPFNYIIGLPNIALASFFGLVVACAVYYISRFKNRPEISIPIVNISGLLLFTFNYFMNSGISGPTDLYFLLFLLLSIVISPTNEYKFWIPVNVGMFLILGIAEYLSPETFPNTYDDRFSKFIDHLSSYLVVAAITFFCTYYIRRSYENEKLITAEKSEAIEKQNEQIIEKNRELEGINAEKNKLMSIVAHDLRSPLGSIQNFLELLTQHDLEEQQKLDIENDLLNATKNTLAMLSKLLDWSKSQLYGVSARPEMLNLSKLLQSTLELEADIAFRKGITLDYQLSPSMSVFADGDMMQIVVRNIIGNATKFTKSGGRITVRANSEHNQCVISVQDDGIGMSAEKSESIFSLNVESTYGTKNEKGVGLGLLLCIEFVKAQNGRIWFESEPGNGTCFYISIPTSNAADTIAPDLTSDIRLRA